MPFDDKAETINALISAVEAIESELGLLPSGVYASVRTRLDILEARINNPLAPAPNVQNPFFIGDTGVTISTGFGAPTESRTFGSLYLREDGYNNQGLYAFRPDSTWHQIDTDPWTAAGDLAGTIYSQTVIGLQGRPVKATAPQIDLEGDGYVLTWGSDGYWEPQIGFYAAGDLAGNKLSQTVVNLQGTKLNIGTPQDGYVLTWDGVDGYWTADRAAVVFDILDSALATNIRSNRYVSQSPIDNTKQGIVNLSSDTSHSSAGVTGNFSSILGGDQNEVITSDYAVVAGGFSNILVNNYTFVGGGNQNVVTGQFAAIAGGQLNTISSDLGFIGSGGGNQLSGTGLNNVIGGGTGNTVIGTSNYSSVLGGNSNSIADNSGFIGGGNNNFIQSGAISAVIAGGNANTVSGALAAVLSGNSATVSGNHGLVVGGGNNTVNADFSVILQGSGSTASSGSGYVTILNGQGNVANAGSDYSVLSGVNNYTQSLYTFVFGNASQVNDSSSNYAVAWGDTNTVLTSPFVNLWGQNNTAVGASYGTVYGFGNSIGGSYSIIQGTGNSVNSAWSTVWGDGNTVHSAANFSVIYGQQNTIDNNSQFGWASGNLNVINGPYNNAWGTFNQINASSQGYSSGWGSNNVVTGDWSNAWGSYNTINSANYANAYGYYHSITNTAGFVHGQYGSAYNSGQYTHSNNSFDGVSPGTAQFSRMVLTGTGTSGASINLSPDSNPSNTLVTQSGKSYDMEIRVLVSDTVAAGVCARYVFNVLAHNESSTLTIDRVEAVDITDNGTSWVGSNWTGIITGSGSGALNIVIPSSGSNTRRATATVEWRELKRN